MTYTCVRIWRCVLYNSDNLHVIWWHIYTRQYAAAYFLYVMICMWLYICDNMTHMYVTLCRCVLFICDDMYVIKYICDNSTHVNVIICRCVLSAYFSFVMIYVITDTWQYLCDNLTHVCVTCEPRFVTVSMWHIYTWHVSPGSWQYLCDNLTHIYVTCEPWFPSWVVGNVVCI